MTWEVNDNMVLREDAIVRIKTLGAESGYKVFKVYYDGGIIETPSSLPDMVDMSLVSIGQVADQA